jgi:hypothetical protein
VPSTAGEDLAQEVERVRELYVGLCDRAQAVLRRALPQVEALQREKSHFTPRLMKLMHSRAAGTLAEADSARLGVALTRLEECGDLLSGWLIALKSGERVTDVQAEIAECQRAIDAFRQSTAELDAVLASFQG